MNTTGLATQFLLRDNIADHRPAGAAFPARDPRVAGYDTGPLGASQLVMGGVQYYDEPPIVSGTALDSGWNPSQWVTQADAMPYGRAPGRAPVAFALPGDGLYAEKRVARDVAWNRPDDESHDWGLNPYDPGTPFMREFHKWAEAQDVAARAGVKTQNLVWADRVPGLSSVLGRPSPLLVMRAMPYPAAPPAPEAAVWGSAVTRVKGQAPPPRGLAPSLVHGSLGARGGGGGGGVTTSYTRADWQAPRPTAITAGAIFH